MPSKYRIIIAIALEQSILSSCEMDKFPLDKIEVYMYLATTGGDLESLKMIEWLIEFIQNNPLDVSNLKHRLSEESGEYQRYKKLIERFNKQLKLFGYELI